ncbi:MAG: PIN domain-containing protein [Fibrobacteria bacterium]
MKSVLLDLNVILDFLNKRRFHAEAAQILDLAMMGKIRAFVSAHEVTTLAYFLEKEKKPEMDYRQVISILLSMVRALPVDQEILERSLRSEITDFEDAVLESVSLQHSLEYIVTRNVKDFRKSRVGAINPSLFLEIESRSPG